MFEDIMNRDFRAPSQDLREPELTREDANLFRGLTQENVEMNRQVSEERERAITAENKKLNKSGGIMTGVLIMDNHQIQKLADPTHAYDAANKKYVDNHSIAPVLSFGTNTDGDPIINMEYEKDGEVFNSPVSFDKDSFEIINNHLKTKGGASGGGVVEVPSADGCDFAIVTFNVSSNVKYTVPYTKYSIPGGTRTESTKNVTVRNGNRLILFRQYNAWIPAPIDDECDMAEPNILKYHNRVFESGTTLYASVHRSGDYGVTTAGDVKYYKFAIPT